LQILFSNLLTTSPGNFLFESDHESGRLIPPTKLPQIARAMFYLVHTKSQKRLITIN
jgi:hypothetical protein